MESVIYENKQVSNTNLTLRLFISFAAIIIALYFCWDSIYTIYYGYPPKLFGLIKQQSYDQSTAYKLLLFSFAIILFFVYELVMMVLIGYIRDIILSDSELIVRFTGVSGYRKVYKLTSIDEYKLFQDRRSLINNKNLTIKMLIKGRYRNLISDKAEIMEILVKKLKKQG